jgi:hypothetical protein
LDKEFARYLLPDGIFAYFNISKHYTIKERFHFYLEEKNLLPKEHPEDLTHSKGFSPEITIEDFPRRGKSG